MMRTAYRRSCARFSKNGRQLGDARRVAGESPQLPYDEVTPAINLKTETLRGNDQREDGGDDESYGPDQVQVYPAFSQDFETDLLIYHEGDQAGHYEISHCMD